MSDSTKTRPAKWGNSLAVRIPKRVIESARLREGDEVTLAVGKDGVIVMRPAQRKHQLRELVSKITARNRTMRRIGVRKLGRKLSDPQPHPEHGRFDLADVRPAGGRVVRTAPAGLRLVSAQKTTAPKRGFGSLHWLLMLVVL